MLLYVWPPPKCADQPLGNVKQDVATFSVHLFITIQETNRELTSAGQRLTCPGNKINIQPGPAAAAAPPEITYAWPVSGEGGIALHLH